MAEAEKGRKEDTIRDGVSRLIKDSEAAAIQVVDSAATVLKAGLDNAEELSTRAGDLLLNTARRAINAGNIVASDAREVTKSMVKGTIQAASEIGEEVKEMASGALGKIYHFRAMYLQDWILPHFNTPYLWRHNKEISGTGALGDFSHIIDIGHFLLGSRIKSVQSTLKNYIPERALMDGSGDGNVDVDDAFASVVEFENGALGTLEGTRLASGRKNYHVFEVNGEKGSVAWNLERLNELEIQWAEGEPAGSRGFQNVLVTEGTDPWISNWWPPGHTIGWEHTFVHEIYHLLDCIVNDKEVGPDGATFEDGYNSCVVADAMVESSETGRRVDCKY